MSRIPSPLKFFGGKAYLASRFAEVAATSGYLHYVEPYAGSLAVLLALNPEGKSEVANDIDGDLMNFWRVLADEDAFQKFRRTVEAVPCSEQLWHEAKEHLRAKERSANVAWAVAFFIHCRQSLGGRMADFMAISRTRVRRGMNEQASAWLSAVEGLAEVHARLKRVVVLNRPALEVIASEDTSQTLFYVDAPYVAEARATPEIYKYEMTNDEHQQLIATLLKIKGKAMVSMYHHPIYDALSDKHGWGLVEYPISNHSSHSKTKKRMVECLWKNF